MNTMDTRKPKYGRQLITVAIVSALAMPASAQQQIESTVPPVFQSVDGNGVDQISGQLVQVMTSLSIGPNGPGGLRYNYANSNSGRTELFGFVEADAPSSGKYTVTIGGSSETFTLSGTLASGTFSQDQGRGSTLTWDGGTSRFTYTGADGRVAVFGQVNPGGQASPPYILNLTWPTGQNLTYYYRLIPATSLIPTPYYQVRSVVSNLGYQLHYDYALAPSGTVYANTGVVLFNRANEACDPTADTCILTGNWPRLTFSIASATEIDATDNLGRLYRWINTQVPPYHNVAGTAGASTMIFPTGRTLTFAVDEWGRVTSASDGRGTWQYTHPNPFGGNTLTYYPEQNGPPRQVNFDTATGQIQSDVTANVTTSYTWANGRISVVAVSGGPSIHYSYDARGNVIETRRVSATPGSPPDIVISATYPSSCTNQRTCNQPTTTTDERGNVTEYTYDPNTGVVLTVKRPAGANGVQPQTVYGYTAYQAYYLNNSGSIVASGSNVYLPTSISSCITGAPASCAGTADEARTTIAYGPQTAGTANNLLPVSTTSGDGTGALAATTTMTYTADGDVETIDEPLAGSADTTRTYYDAARRPTGTISADPDGAGSLPRLATRTIYNDDDQPTTVESGTATDQSATGMSTFSSLRQQVTAYDAQGRATSVRLNAGGTTYALTQSSTTVSGLPDCTAVRMNPTTFASLPASACTPATTGSDGPDRISQVGYDWYRRLPATVTTGVGSGTPFVEATTAYDSLNRVQSVTDGEGNLTTYEYDGLGRRTRIYYPSSTQGAGTSNPANYEQLTYATATVGGATVSTSLVGYLQLRDGRSINYGYDNLGRPTSKDPPGTDADVAYTYDNLGRMTSALFSATGQGVTNNFDALDRLTSTSSSMGGTTRTLSYQYDLAGDRTRITHPGGTYFVTMYDGLSRPVGMLLNGTDAMRYAQYHASGTRSAFGSTAYSYDPVQRLTGQTHYFASGGGSAGSIGSTYAYNPAGQLNQVTRDNDAYAWIGHYAVNRAYTTNGLNQHLTAGSTGFSYDTNGNLTSDGSTTFGYDAENRLVSASGAHSASLAYDPLGRLWQLTSGSNTTRFLYDGDALVAEYDGSGNLTRRHAHWPGVDAPIVSYEPNGQGGLVPHYLSADERGSIIAVTDAAASVLAVNTYDEYGIPGAGNSGRFQYTGQAWLSELGIYYYKARMYSPTLGRFMQTDPIGYGAGMNLYNYVNSDPVSYTDPMGLFQACWSVDVPDLGPYSNSPTSSPTTPNAIVVTGHRSHSEQHCYDVPDMTDKNPTDLSRTGPPPPGGAPPPSVHYSPATPSRANRLCGFLLNHMGEDPVQMVTDLMGSYIGNRIGQVTQIAALRVLNNVAVEGSRLESITIAGARAGRIGGVVGAIAGALAGMYFQRDLERLINNFCSRM